MGNNIFLTLKICLEVSGSNLTNYASGLEKPNGDVGVSRTTVTRVAKGEFVIPWIREAIINTIISTKRDYPEELELLATTLHPLDQTISVPEVV